MGDHLDIDRLGLQKQKKERTSENFLRQTGKKATHLDSAAGELFRGLEPPVHRPPDVPLESPAKVLEHGGPAAEDNVGVETPAHVDGAVLDDGVDGLGDGDGEVGVGELGVEEDLGAEEALVADVDAERLLRHAVHAVVLLDVPGK